MDKNKMLIDATHPEETRVVALRNGRVEEFDFESAARKLLRGNIYLAKVTRVEPSLQAAFIDYGGNRHGFLAFNEIHPDYYQIPVADREALKQEEAEAERYAEAEIDERARQRGPRRRRRPRNGNSTGNGGRSSHGESQPREAHDDQDAHEAASEVDTFEDGYQTSGSHEVEDNQGRREQSSAPLRHDHHHDDIRHEPASEAPEGDWSAPAAPATGERHEASHEHEPHEHGHEPGTARHSQGDWSVEVPAPAHGRHDHDAPLHDTTHEARHIPADDEESDDDDAPETNGNGDDDQVEQVATEEDALEELPERPRRRARQYKIQEVIKRRQIMLVQVVKEERGNKGAALTTYISLAGRYTVLMPNTARGGGISRKITQPQDRKRLKAIAEELDVEEGMGLIIRTAGAARTKQEIKRDYDYLMRLWENVRELTLTSTAPCLVYEEGNLIKRAIRDLYSKDFDQIVVAGETAHREAQDFMEMLMPGSGNQVASYRAPEPLFARYGIERQLNALFSPYVTLRSGGYIVINQTEALVSVDVNSGKSTREFSIEETALNTNIEAAEEIARQLKLRDLAGLIVVDFIDMEEKRNNRHVERRLKDALRFDRARIQVGRISHFGLLEMSRQRLRAGVLEGSTSQCPHCQGTGIIRSIESVALAVLRGLEDNLLKQPASLVAQTTAEVALYILNHKRAFIVDMERRHGVSIRVESSDRMQGANFGIERIAAPVLAKPASRQAVSMEWGFDREEGAVEAADLDEPELEAAAPEEEQRPRDEGSEEERRGRRRRRRRGRNRDGDPRDGEPAHADAASHPGHADDDGFEAEPHAHDEPSHANDDHDAGGPEGSADADAAEVDGDVSSPEAHDGSGETRRRGRRRGRRGGRSRRREGGESDGMNGDRHEWGIAELAQPGAEQPSGWSRESQASSMGLVGSAEAGGFEPSLEREIRPGIVEDFDAGREAVRLAVRLAGGGQRRNRQPRAERGGQRSQMMEQSTSATPAPAAPALVAPLAAPIRPIVAPVPNSSPNTETAPSSMTVMETPGASLPVATERASEPLEKMVSHEVRNGAQAEPEHSHSPSSSPTPDLADDPSRPARRGWWQRRFGGAE